MDKENEKIDKVQKYSNKTTKEDESQNKSKKQSENKKFTILGFSIWRIFTYFIIYSVLGYVIETIFGIITKGTWESRQSFLYGPFCGIYGLGAVIMIVFLQYFNKNNNTLFWGGFLVGSITEYIMSFLGEKLFNVIWWDYSNMPLNINGRVCVFFSIFWGLLGIYLITYVNPKIDRLIEYFKKKVSLKKLKIITAVVTIFLFIDFLLTGFAVKMFYVRMIHNNDIQVKDKEKVEELYNKIYDDDKLVEVIEKFFSDKKMIRTFPNLKVTDVNSNILYFDSYLRHIQPYYYKFDKSLKDELVDVLKGKRE